MKKDSNKEKTYLIYDESGKANFTKEQDKFIRDLIKELKKDPNVTFII